MNPRGAIPSGPISHVDEEYAGATEELRKQRDSERREELKATKQVAALADHPGWQTVVSHVEAKISAYRSGEALRAGIESGDITNEHLGELVRVALLVADELSTMLGEVTTAVAALEQLRQEDRRDARNRPVA